MQKFQQYFIPILCAAILVSGLAGFGIGRGTAGGRQKPTDTAAAEATQESTESAEATQETTAATEAATLAEAEPEETQPSVSEITDAADLVSPDQISSGNHDSSFDFDMDAGEGVNEDEKSTVDPAYIANPTVREAELPDGVASTLYSKTGDEAMQIVVFGDSQFANFLGKDGMAYKLSQKAQANVYNLAIGGTAAAIGANDVADNARFNDDSLTAWIKVITGQVSPEIFAGNTYQYNVYKSCDFSKTDVFVLEYGVNDYFQKSRVVDDVKDQQNFRTYQGALQYAVWQLRENFPDAQIIICAPTYAEFFDHSTGAFIGDYYTLNNGLGTLEEYVEAAINVQGDHKNTMTIVPSDDLDVKIDAYNADEYLLDGVHLTEKGRELYSQFIARMCVRFMGYEIPEDTDPGAYDWRS